MVVLLSGEGTNLQAILDTVHGRDGIEVVGVAASRRAAPGLERAERASLPTAVFEAADFDDREERDSCLAEWVADRRADLVVLAGWMELLRPIFIRRFRGRIINVHPSLLPAFPGIGAIEQALSYGVRVTGVTVHFVDEGVDTGAIIAQEALDLSYARGIGAVEHSIHQVEHRLLPQVVRLFARGAVRVDRADPRWVLIEEEAS